MKNYQLVIQLIQLVEQFETDNPTATALELADFTTFLNARFTKEVSTDENKFGNKAKKSQMHAMELESNISRLITYMSRYSKHYSKIILDKTPLQTIDDFSYLATLMTHESLTKSELITKNIQEKTTGTEVIRRLIALNLVQQMDDPNDKRSKRINITPEGRRLLISIFKDMGVVSAVVTGNLTTEEKMNLLYLLKKLDDFHYNIYTSEKLETVEDLKLISQC